MDFIQAVEKLKSEYLTNVEAVQLDVTDEHSVKTAREVIGKKTASLDVFINNAGINGGGPYTALEANSDQFVAAFIYNQYFPEQVGAGSAVRYRFLDELLSLAPGSRNTRPLSP